MNSIVPKLLFVNKYNYRDVIKYNENRIANTGFFGSQEMKKLIGDFAKINCVAAVVFMAAAVYFPTVFPAAVVIAVSVGSVGVITAIAYGVLHIRDLRYHYAKEMWKAERTRHITQMLDALGIQVKDLNRYAMRTGWRLTPFADPNEFPEGCNFMWDTAMDGNIRLYLKVETESGVRVVTASETGRRGDHWDAFSNDVNDPTRELDPREPGCVMANGTIDPYWKQFFKEHIPQPQKPVTKAA